MSEGTSDGKAGRVKNRYVAPDFKRRQLIFDSFAKLKETSTSGGPSSRSSLQNSAGSGAKGTLLYAWGAGYHGQLGLSAFRKKSKLVPAWIDFKEPVLQVAAGGFFSAVLTDSGRVYTWGDGRMGQLGNLARKHNMLATPHLVDRLTTPVRQVSLGQAHAACVDARGDLHSWGSGKYGQLGLATRLDQRYPCQVDADVGKFRSVSCGDRHTAAITKDFRVVTFGSGQHGQLGHGNGWDYLRPKVVEALEGKRVVDVTAGSTFTCFITAAGELYLSGFGEAIHPKEFNNIVDTPRRVKMRERVRSVACGQSHILVLSEEGNVYAFGSNSMGQLGTGTTGSVRHPRLVLKGKNVREIAAGRYHSMAVSQHGVVYSFGCSESGQLAHNSLENELFPRVVDAILPNVVGQISCGEHHSLCLSSIEHSSIAKDVLSWMMVEDAELAFKKGMLANSAKYPDAANGLKTKHVLLVERERERIIKQIEARLSRDRDEQRRHLKEQLESISAPEDVMQEEHEHARLRGDAEAAVVEPPTAEEQQHPAGEGWGGSGGGKRTMHASRSSPALPRGTAAAAGEADADAHHHPHHGPSLAAPASKHARSQAALPPRSSQQAAAAAAADGDEQAQHQPGGGGQQQRAVTAWDGQAAAAAGAGAAPASDPHAFQPLLPRMAFIEKTTTTLQRVRKYLHADVLKPAGVSSKELFGSKAEYNQLRSVSRAKTRQLQELRNQYVFMRPTDEDTHRMVVNEERIKDLNMKLVTLNTRLMEADENKKNYELYIIRMKEEDVALSKQIDHLRHLVGEYDRLLQKMERMNTRVHSQKKEIDEEIGKFQADVRGFHDFAGEQLLKYRELINRNAVDARVQEKMALDRDSKVDERRTKRLARLQGELHEAGEEAGEIKEELETWQSRVQFYEKRFHKITAATGLSDPDEIINKFFFNDEITDDLRKEIRHTEKELARSHEAKESLEGGLEEQKTCFVQSKWRDVDDLQARLDEETLRVARQRQEFDRVTQRLAFVLEGTRELVHSVDSQIGPDRKRPVKADGEFGSEFDRVRWWGDYLDERVSALAELASRKQKQKKAAEGRSRQHQKQQHQQRHSEVKVVDSPPGGGEGGVAQRAEGASA